MPVPPASPEECDSWQDKAIRVLAGFGQTLFMSAIVLGIVLFLLSLYWEGKHG